MVSRDPSRKTCVPAAMSTPSQLLDGEVEERIEESSNAFYECQMLPEKHVFFFWRLGRQSLSLYTSLRPAPTARCSLALGPSFGAGHGSPGAAPLDPLVRMFNPSSYTHAKSQLLCSISLNFFFFFKQHK